MSVFPHSRYVHLLGIAVKRRPLLDSRAIMDLNSYLYIKRALPTRACSVVLIGRTGMPKYQGKVSAYFSKAQCITSSLHQWPITKHQELEQGEWQEAIEYLQ